MKGTIRVLTKEGGVVESDKFTTKYAMLSMMTDAIEKYPDHLIELNIRSKA